MRLFVAIDPSLTNTGIVGLDENGRVAFSETIRTKPHGKSRTLLFQRWSDIALEAETIFCKVMKPHHAAHRFLIYAPLHLHGKVGIGASLLPFVNGMMFGMVWKFATAVVLRDDSQVRITLRQVGYNVPKSKNKGDMTRFVRGYWKECPNSHEADAWLGAKYLML